MGFEASKERWQRISTLFDEVVDEPPEVRDDLLRAACGEDGELRRDVLALLEASEKEEGVVDRPAGIASAETLQRLLADPDGESASLSGTLLGPWRLEREIGRGGMGVVWLAERADGQFAQRAALKLIKRGLDTDEIVGRFRRERQILARLQHPNIARLLDGGVSGDGRPWLAMEYVEGGTPLVQWCDTAGAAPKKRLGLFLDACAAVQYAHRNLIVHRDLKPSNILVTADGEVKLLDFGMARLLEEDAPDADRTRSGSRWLTPAYAAPEQLRGGVTTTATDVYALGLVLYELLSGKRAVVARGDNSPPLAPPSRDASAPMGHLLRGDLDSIVLRALRDEPENRYPSVEALADDLRRWLGGHPVVARRASRMYRGRKFFRRHRLGVSVAAMAALAVLAGGALATYGMIRARRSEAAAQGAANTANEAVRFFSQLFEEATPDRSHGAPVTASDILARGAKWLESDARYPPALRARLGIVIGTCYQQMGLFSEARTVLEKTVARAGAALTARDPELPDALNNLATLDYRTDRLSEARALYERALEIRTATLGPDHPEVARILHNLANTLSMSGQPGDARPMLERALAIREHAFGPRSAEAALTLEGLAQVRAQTGDAAGAIEMARRSVEIDRERLGPDHSATLSAAVVLATIYFDHEQFEDARGVYEQVLESRKKVLGANHPELADAYYNLGNTLLKLGDAVGSVAALRRAVEIYEAALPAGHPFIADAHENLAQALLAMNDREAAAEELRMALDIAKDKSAILESETFSRLSSETALSPFAKKRSPASR
jgi:serine/threonine-protein kinase